MSRQYRNTAQWLELIEGRLHCYTPFCLFD